MDGQLKTERTWQVPFFTIWTGQSLSLLGSRIARFALIWWLTDQTGSAVVLTTATLISMLPDIFLAPIAGVYIDRWNRRRVMMIADTCIALASLVLAYLFWRGIMQVWQVYAVMLIGAVGNSFHWPAMEASTTMLVPKKHLARVAGFNQTMQGIRDIVGPLLGALFLEIMSLQWVMLVDVGTAFFAVVPLFFIDIPQPSRKNETQKFTFWEDMRGGMSYLRQARGLLILIIFAMIFKIALSPAFSLLPLLIKDFFGKGAGELSLIQSINGIGIILGGLLLGIWGGFHHRIHTFLTGVIGLGITLFLVGLIPAQWFWPAVGIFFLMGITISLVDGPFIAIQQAVIAPEMQGRVFSLMGSLLSITSPLGLAIAGPVTDAVGMQIWYVIAGVLCILTGIAGYLIPAVNHIENIPLPPNKLMEQEKPIKAKA